MTDANKSIAVAAAVVLLIVTASAIERVSTDPVATYFRDWGDYTSYLYRNESDGTLVILSSTSDDDNMTLKATAIVNASYDDIGWDFAYFSGEGVHNKSTRRDAYYHTGYIEGATTTQRINQVYQVNLYNTTAQEEGWIDEHIAFMTQQVETQSATSAFWAKVGDLFELMRGIADGYNSAATAGLGQFSFKDIFKMNFAYEIGDVIEHFAALADPTSASRLSIARAQAIRGQHCSALIKVTDDDIFFSHDTWSTYTNLLRQYKTYGMETVVTFSGYAGQIASGDDWYMTSNGLAVQETTNGYYFPSLAAMYVLPDSVSEFLRVMVANFVATNGSEWARHFSTQNDGAYCNSYMVLDGKLFNGDTKKLSHNLLWISEQMPGYVHSRDITFELQNNRYFASYNIPYFDDVRERSGFVAMEQTYGNFFSYTKYARAEIFARDQSNVKDLDGMRRIMRSNDWTTDPLSVITNCSNCTPANSPMLALSSRADLVPENAVLPSNGTYAAFFQRGAFGGIDSKITSARMVMEMRATVICGPTHLTQPVFNFSTTSYARPPGAADVYNFPWVTFVTPTHKPHGWYSSLAPTTAVVLGIFGALVGCAVVAAIAVRAIRAKRSGDSDGAYTRV